MSGKPGPGGHVSSAYLAGVMSFLGSGLLLMKAFEVLVAQRGSQPSLLKAGLCLLLFVASCWFVQRRNYFQDREQHRRIMNLQLRFPQVLLALALLVFWAVLRMVLFGSA